MKSIPYIILYSCATLFAILPLRILYFFSDAFFYLNYYIIKYRKKIVFENLRNSFPEKSEKEIKTIAQNFYRHFGDLFVETLKLVHLPKKESQRRIRLKNPEILDSLYKENKMIFVAMGHYNNWEWISLLTRPEFQIISIYKTLHNNSFDKFIYTLRTMKGCILVSTSQTLRFLSTWDNPSKRAFLCFIADQSPQKKDTHYWTRFLNQSTSIFIGIEKIAVKSGVPVCYFSIQKIKRGYYELEVIPITPNASATKPYEITEAHVRLLEKDIMNKPEFWLWSHRRWKRKQINNEIINTQPDD